MLKDEADDRFAQQYEANRRGHGEERDQAQALVELRAHFSTVFVGGGTPTLVPPEQRQRAYSLPEA